MGGVLQTCSHGESFWALLDASRHQGKRGRCLWQAIEHAGTGTAPCCVWALWRFCPYATFIKFIHWFLKRGWGAGRRSNVTVLHINIHIIYIYDSKRGWGGCERVSEGVRGGLVVVVAAMLKYSRYVTSAHDVTRGYIRQHSRGSWAETATETVNYYKKKYLVYSADATYLNINVTFIEKSVLHSLQNKEEKKIYINNKKKGYENIISTKIIIVCKLLANERNFGQCAIRGSNIIEVLYWRATNAE